MNSSSGELKAYATKILVAVAIVLVLYGIFYIADLFGSYLGRYEYVSIIWLIFRLFLAVAIIYIGTITYKFGHVVSKISMGSSRNILFFKKKWSFFVLSLMILCISIPILILFYASPLLAEYYCPYSGHLIYEDRLAGYFGYADDDTYLGVRIADTIDLQTLYTRAQAYGYDVIQEYDVTTYYYTINRTVRYEKTPRVTIKQGIILNENKSVTFIISAYNEGFVKINVESKYFLDTNWIRGIFAKMFNDIGLPTIGIWKFTIVENWIGTVD